MNIIQFLKAHNDHFKVDESENVSLVVSLEDDDLTREEDGAEDTSSVTDMEVEDVSCAPQASNKLQHQISSTKQM